MLDTKLRLERSTLGVDQPIKKSSQATLGNDQEPRGIVKILNSINKIVLKNNSNHKIDFVL